MVETAVILAIPIFLACTLLVSLEWKQRSEVGRAWLAAAERSGLQDISLRRHAGWVTDLRARHGLLSVRLCFVRAEDLVRSGTRIVLGGLPRDLEMRRVDSLDPFVGVRTGLPIGDDKFDAMLSVDGSRRQILAALDSATRDRAREVFADRKAADFSLSPRAALKPPVSLANGRLAVDCYQGREPLIVPLLRTALAFAAALVPCEPLEPRLAENVRRDPEPAVRLNNLRELLAGTRRHPDTVHALRAALADENEQVQLEAAVALGSEGRPVLLDIASRQWSADACAARAVAELRSALPIDQARTILTYALRTRRLETARACVESLSHRGSEDSDTFARVLALEDGALAAAAARALGRVGGATAVPALAEAQRRLAGDEDVREAVREAIAAIQSRAHGARPGQLSLAGDESGQVSLASDEEGRVALVPPRDPVP